MRSSKHKNKEDPKNYSIKCGVKDCGINIANIDELYKHYRRHLNQKIENSARIYCFYKNCDHEGSSSSAFACHLTKYHSKDVKNMKDEF